MKKKNKRWNWEAIGDTLGATAVIVLILLAVFSSCTNRAYNAYYRSETETKK